ncbi:MAG: F420-dependent methylenetetrahydromethanopterin dehydrogenase [Candidatus Lokiarchaeota archaeon]|nr:F420-dependent methylenetetrahydromethanopterin dehydrogenase [Candidatus Lokiarchaeota archaeon]
MINIGILKFGCIGATPLLEMIIDERADREDISVKVIGTGSSMKPEACEAATSQMIQERPDLVIIVSPNAALKGPKLARKLLEKSTITTLTISDAPASKAFYKKNEEGQKEPYTLVNQGFIIITADSMIGARREFLDPTEMVMYNADVLKVLAATGVFRALHEIIDSMIEGIKINKVLLPTKKITEDVVYEYGGYENPYAEAKAYAAFRMAKEVSGITTRACFRESDSKRYIPLVAAGHELMRSAALLVDEAREIEKSRDSVLRTSHKSDGKISERKELGK